MASSRPPFLYPPGSPLMHPPLALDRARMYGFWVPGDQAALQASVDRTLNACSRDRMRFTVWPSCVMLTFTEIDRAYSLYPQDRDKGWGREADIVTWVMLTMTKTGEQWPPAFYAYPLHIWVDDCMALIVGREVFGYPKYLCSYAMPGPDEPPDRFRLAAKGFQPFAPETEMSVHPLLGVDAAVGAKRVTRVRDAAEWRRHLLASLPAHAGLGGAEPGVRAAFDRWFDQFPGLGQIFLKQFPDASGQKAVYQAIVAAQARVKAIHGLWLLDDRYTLDLQAFDSFPLSRTLGWKLGPQPAYGGFRVDFDFQVDDGVELVDNSRSGEEAG